MTVSELIADLQEFEEWRDIEGYEWVYQISSFGRIKSLERIDNNNHLVKERILKQSIKNTGYMGVYLYSNRIGKSKLVHRLVAQAFIPNQYNKPVVNHLDEDKTNNNVNNLEWVTAKENINYGTGIDRRAKSISIPIKVIYQDNTYEIWQSASLFAREFGNGVDKRYISSVLKGKMKSHLGLRFEYAEVSS